MTGKRMNVMEGATLRDLRLRELKVHPEIQRKFVPSRARKLLAEFDPARLTPLGVNHERGQYLVYEGQHRLWAITHYLNGDSSEQAIPCWVREQADHAELAKDRLSQDAQMKMTPIDRFLMAVIGQEAEAVAVKTVLARYGLAVAQTAGDGVVQCVGACRRIADRPGGVKMLDRVIAILSRAFGKNAGGYHRDLVGALGLLVYKHGEQLDDARVITVLTGTQKGALGLVNAGKDVARGLGATSVYGVITCLLRAYNKGRKNKLDFDR